MQQLEGLTANEGDSAEKIAALTSEVEQLRADQDLHRTEAADAKQQAEELKAQLESAQGNKKQS